MEKQELTQVEKERRLERLAQFCRDTEQAFEIDGPITATVLRADGTYRNYPIEPCEFFFLGARFGETGKEIFIFEPEDTDERYVKLEVKVKEIDKFFPMFFGGIKDLCRADYVSKMEGMEQELIEASIEATESGPEMLSILYDLELQSLRKDAADEESRMKSNPNFGVF